MMWWNRCWAWRRVPEGRVYCERWKRHSGVHQNRYRYWEDR